MPGPKPKHPSVRARANNPKKDFRTLPSEGRKGKAPKWPLQAMPSQEGVLQAMQDRIAQLQAEEPEATTQRLSNLRKELRRLEMESAVLKLEIEQTGDGEKALWNDLWKMPQAVLWEEAHAHREVAQYVRWKIMAEQGDKKAAVEARQLSDRLGLNPKALLTLKAEIERVDEAEDKGQRRRSKPKPATAKPGKADPRSGLYAV